MTRSSRRCRWWLAVFLIVSSGTTREASAQSTSAAVVADSAAWRQLLTYVVKQLADDIVAAARDSSPRAWRIVMPDSTPLLRAFASHLRMVLRARDPMDGDTEVRELVIGPLRVSGDTIRLQTRTSYTRVCPDGVSTTGFGNVEEPYVYRVRGQFWSVARSDRVAHGDRLPCERRRP
jgi:hypothetical protein